MATPFCSPLFAFQPSACRMFCGEAQIVPQDSVTPSAMTDGSLNAFRISACIAPTPHEFIGCVGSVQFEVLMNGVGWPANASTPLPDMTFQKATFSVASAARAGTAELAITRIASTHEYTLRATRLFIVGPAGVKAKLSS